MPYALKVVDLLSSGMSFQGGQDSLYAAVGYLSRGPPHASSSQQMEVEVEDGLPRLLLAI